MSYIVEATLDGLDQRLMPVLAIWQRATGAGRPLRRRDLDPLAFPHLLATSYLIDVIRQGHEDAGGHHAIRYRYRLIGSTIVERLGRDRTGWWLDEVYPPETFRMVARSFDEVIRRRAPVRSHGDTGFANSRAHYLFDALELPLVGDGMDDPDRITAIFGVLCLTLWPGIEP
ncbi:PAS domain-containing protein [Tistrella mobilis]|uniref:PAS domain-containing protein n=1 Tax=Tistrella mobilis TaxID=171437 RepID=UPI003558C92B